MLENMGYPTQGEAGRAIIQDQQRIGGNALPWIDPRAFAEQMLAWDMRSFSNAQREAGPVFLDRGIPDTIGYLELSGLPVPAHMEKAACVFRYEKVFCCVPGRRFSRRTASAGRAWPRPSALAWRWSASTAAWDTY
ncbi:AAA family ATPase [Chromobacterium violaceum]|nr:AAA family ATPase [Chromobacterium violaceum]MCD0494535.1 AAA family ATPase [Chromobacterium violaceum]